MASKSRSKAGKQKPLEVKRKRDESEGKALARFGIQPTVNGALTIADYCKSFGDIELSGLVDELSDLTKAVHDSDLKRPEALLMVQAQVLDAIFNNLARRAAAQEYLKQFETHLRLAFKAQSQCRATLETLAAIKNPQPVAFVKQANIAHNQQVNNAPAEPARPRKIENVPNELFDSPSVTDGLSIPERVTTHRDVKKDI